MAVTANYTDAGPVRGWSPVDGGATGDAFPMGRHNDQVDAASCAFSKLLTPPKTAMILGGGKR